MKEAARIAIEALKPVVREGVAGAVTAKGKVDSHVVEDIVKETAKVVVNKTNSEPWYQSRVTWGAIIAMVAGVAGIFGYTFDGEDQAALVQAIVGGVSVVGGVIAWYGRWVAKKPLGS